MAFLKIQKLKRDAEGQILSGSAAIVEVVYHPERKFHSSQQVRERLGKVITLAEDRKSGTFLSPTRGLVKYDVRTDTFTPVCRDDLSEKSISIFTDPEIHTVFGDVYLLLKFLEKQGFISLFQSVFQKKAELERFLLHVLYGVLKDVVLCQYFGQYK